MLDRKIRHACKWAKKVTAVNDTRLQWRLVQGAILLNPQCGIFPAAIIYNYIDQVDKSFNHEIATTRTMCRGMIGDER